MGINTTEGAINEGKETLDETDVDATNNLGLVVFSIVFGFALKSIGEDAEIVVGFLNGLANGVTKTTSWIIWFGPLGIISMVCYQILIIQDFTETLRQLGLYVISCLLVSSIHGLMVMPALFTMITRRNPFPYLYNMTETFPVALATSSGIICYPISAKCLEEKNGIPENVVRFTLSILVTTNWLVVSPVSIMFLQQLEGSSFSISKTIILCIILCFLAVGSAGFPQDNLIVIFVAASILNMPIGYNIVKIISIEWLVDRYSTMMKMVVDAMIV